MKKKILVFGPIADFGGRELETAFIAAALSADYEVAVCSSAMFAKESQVFHFNKKLKVFSLNSLVYRRFLEIRLSAMISFLKNRHRGKISDYANNNFAKRTLGFNQKRNQILKALIAEYDLILICAQLSSNHVGEVVRIANEHKKKVIFRTTGAINSHPYEYADAVDCFIHHSINNARQLNTARHHYEIIDQCAYDETGMLKISAVNGKTKTFLTIARLVKEKNIDVVIAAFRQSKTLGDQLYVVGDGPELQHLKWIAANDADIIFTGFLPHDQIAAFFSKADCVLISHYEFETGPLTAIEAMAAGRLIVSAKTGAMPERLPFNHFWFDNNVDDLCRQLIAIKKLEPQETLILSQKIRNRYLESYSSKCIAARYRDVVYKVLTACE